jgi:hypothetical protein
LEPSRTLEAPNGTRIDNLRADIQQRQTGIVWNVVACGIAGAYQLTIRRSIANQAGTMSGSAVYAQIIEAVSGSDAEVVSSSRNVHRTWNLADQSRGISGAGTAAADVRWASLTGRSKDADAGGSSIRIA